MRLIRSYVVSKPTPLPICSPILTRRQSKQQALAAIGFHSRLRIGRTRQIHSRFLRTNHNSMSNARRQLMQEYVQKSIITTLPRGDFRSSGAEFSQPTAPPKSGIDPASGRFSCDSATFVAPFLMTASMSRSVRGAPASIHIRRDPHVKISLVSRRAARGGSARNRNRLGSRTILFSSGQVQMEGIRSTARERPRWSSQSRSRSGCNRSRCEFLKYDSRRCIFRE
jgi:hypothetical protein